MKTFTAITLNIVYPGSGYLYLKDSFRKQIAIFLASIWTLFLISIIYYLIKGWVTNDPYLFATPIEIPFLAFAMWAFMCIDTYRLSKELENKQSRQ